MRVGVDLVALDQFIRRTEKPAFLKTVYSPAELEQVGALSGQRRLEWLAARFAAKEAVAKALGTGFDGDVDPASIEILVNPVGAPEVRMNRAASDRAQAMGLTEVTVSLSHEAGMAIAFAVLS